MGRRLKTTYFLLTDQVGTLRAVADTSGNIVKRIDYDSFGNIIADTNPGFSVLLETTMRRGIEEYGVFGIVATIACSWHAFAILMARIRPAAGLLPLSVSVIILYGIWSYIRWLDDRGSAAMRTTILILSQVPLTIVFVFQFLSWSRN